MLKRAGSAILTLLACTLSLIAETWQWARIERRHKCTAYPMSDGIVCPGCGDFTPWDKSARCTGCGAFL